MIPVPSSAGDPLPATSAIVDVGLSRPLNTFVPLVARMCQKQDDASMLWTDENRYLKMACNGKLAEAA